jgi:[acyl-carrier-protein] S-malonyltransferase
MAEEVKVAYVFPGQGSQKVGMGQDLYIHYASAKQVYDQVDEILGFSLSRLCFEGPEEDLLQTINVQAAVLTTSIACLKAAEEATKFTLPHPTYVLGHSLGEYTSLVVAGVLGLSDAVRLVRERGRLMNEAGRRKKGGMLAIMGLELPVVENICLSVGTVVSNVNCPGQIVISGAQENLDKARRLAQIKGARRVIPLKVSGAFHSNLMEPAMEGLKNAVSGLTFNKPMMPIIANVTAQPLTAVETIREELISQIIHCVKWQQSVEATISKGVTTFFEIGPGEVLTGLIKRISPGAQTFNINNVDSLTEIANWRRG